MDLRCLWYILVEINIWVGYFCLEFRKYVLEGDIDLGVINIEMVIKVRVINKSVG